VYATCFLDICAPLTLDNGTIDCEYGDNGGPNAGDMCSLACSDGLLLNGSDVRTCMDDGTWSGDDGVCYFSKILIRCIVEVALGDLRFPETGQALVIRSKYF